MSNIPNQWEADIRQQVQDHVFDYDSAAWGDMEALLDGATPGPVADDKVPPTASGGWGSVWIGTCLFLGLVLLVWWLQPGDAVNSTTLGSWPIQVNEPIEKGATEAPEKELLPSPKRQVPPPTQVSLPVNQKVLNPPVKPIDLPAPIERLVIVTPDWLPTLALPDSLTSLASAPTVPIGTVKLNESLQKRKRDRRALFPDVINNY